MLLTGCGLPPPAIVVSYAVDGISYVVSSKGLTDHALSALTNRDCALHRVVTEAILCRDDILGSVETLAMVDAPATDDGRAIGRSLLEVRDVEPAPAAVATEATYLVVGSFFYWVNSQRFAELYPALAPAVVPAIVQGEIFYRVVTLAGPERNLSTTLRQ